MALDAIQQAVALWRDDPSELANEDWALPEVEERRLRLVHLASRAGELSLAKGQPEDARRLERLAFSVDPWSERAHYLIVAGHHAAGDDRAARRALEHYQDRLDELGLTPATATTRATPTIAAGARFAARRRLFASSSASPPPPAGVRPLKRPGFGDRFRWNTGRDSTMPPASNEPDLPGCMAP